MTEILALENLYNGVRAFFDAQGWECYQPFGWREPAQQQTARNRIAWVPGDRSGFIGNMIGPSQPGGVPRYLAVIKETFYVLISTWADDVEPETELLQWRSTRKLFDQWYTAATYVAHGTFELVRPEWIQLHKERRSGTALVVTMTIQSPIADQSNDAVTAPSPVRGVIDVTELDVTEQVIVGEAPIAVAACSTGPLVLADEQTVDDVLCLDGASVLVNNQADSRDNGLYTVVLDGAWVRTADVLVEGFFVQVLPGGAVNGDTGYQLITSDPVVVGASPIVFELVGPIRTQSP
jgi:hypothetical protein